MRNLPLFTLLGAALAGCVPFPNAPQVPTENWVDEQIAQSATSISLAQQRLHQTNAVKPYAPPPVAVPIPTKTIPPISVSPPVVIASAAPQKPDAKAVASPIVGQQATASVLVTTPATGPTPSTVPKAVLAATSTPVAAAHPAAVSVNPVAPSSGIGAGGGVKAPVAASTPVPVIPTPKPPKAWKVSPEDKTIRETLAKWSAAEGWTFNPRGRDYWTVPQDFDVVASDTFYGDFKDVVRKLIASTQLTSTPLQPCFFKNRAVRVILINEECAAQASQAWKL